MPTGSEFLQQWNANSPCRRHQSVSVPSAPTHSPDSSARRERQPRTASSATCDEEKANSLLTMPMRKSPRDVTTQNRKSPAVRRNPCGVARTGACHTRPMQRYLPSPKPPVRKKSNVLTMSWQRTLWGIARASLKVMQAEESLHQKLHHLHISLIPDYALAVSSRYCLRGSFPRMRRTSGRLVEAHATP